MGSHWRKYAWFLLLELSWAMLDGCRIGGSQPIIGSIVLTVAIVGQVKGHISDTWHPKLRVDCKSESVGKQFPRKTVASDAIKACEWMHMWGERQRE